MKSFDDSIGRFYEEAMVWNITYDYSSYADILPAGSFYWKSYAGNSTDSENYTTWNTSDTWYFTINKQTPNMTLYLNGTHYETLTSLPKVFNIIASLRDVLTGFLNIPKTVYLYVNTTFSQSGTSPLTNTSSWSTVGVFNITGEFQGNENYTSANDTMFLTIETKDINVTLNSVLFRINATSKTGNFTPYNQSSTNPIYNVTNNGTITVNVSFKLNGTVHSCMSTHLISTNSTFEWALDYNVTNTTWTQIITDLPVNSTQALWMLAQYENCPAGRIFYLDHLWNITSAVT